MTSHRSTAAGHTTDRLSKLIQRALSDNVGQAQPPAYVWMNIRQKLGRRVESKARVSVHREGLYWPAGAFGIQEGSFPLSLACIVELQMPVMRRIGWAT
jgi:hypothetical protein